MLHVFAAVCIPSTCKGSVAVLTPGMTPGSAGSADWVSAPGYPPLGHPPMGRPEIGCRGGGGSSSSQYAMGAVPRGQECDF